MTVGQLNQQHTADLYPVGGVAACDGDFRGEKQSKFLLRDRLGALSVCSLDLLNRLGVKAKSNIEKRPFSNAHKR